ncbi:MAG: TlpA family protein disulfide reductase [Saprospiraceae bacterium]|uniref:TlpA family protein disulfide reductase n=1 Tax=Candidatus Opimibacter skivensis TaxID=2982028 RepID=A0A9D7XVQ1_9BACT|nr:TlpA family protein disulfide reductase [Candidatus Opimibacter skivensis]
MKSILYVLLLASFAFGFTLPDGEKKVPNVTITNLQGKPINIQEYVVKGKITILSFWATWCSPCKRELDAVSELYPTWQSDYNTQLIAISIDNARAVSQVKPLIEEKGWEFEVLVDSKQELQQALNFQAIPQTFVVDTEGNIVYQHEGYTPGDEYELEKFVKKLAGK